MRCVDDDVAVDDVDVDRLQLPRLPQQQRGKQSPAPVSSRTKLVFHGRAVVLLAWSLLFSQNVS